MFWFFTESNHTLCIIKSSFKWASLQLQRSHMQYSYHTIFALTKLRAAIICINQHDISFGSLHHAFASSVKKLQSYAFWGCLGLLSRNARAGGMAVKGCDKDSSGVLTFPTCNLNACRSSLRISTCFGVFYSSWNQFHCCAILLACRCLLLFHLLFYSFINKSCVTILPNLLWS